MLQTNYVSTLVGQHDKIAALRSDAWEQSRTKLAELVDEQDFEHLVSCYGSLSILKDKLLDPHHRIIYATDEEDMALVKSISSHHWLAFEVCRVQTKRYRAWSNGMLVSKPDDSPSELEEA